MGMKAIARKVGVLALEISAARVAIALPHGHVPPAGTWRKLPDGRYASPPPARQALLSLVKDP
jgi:hypothetical protein